MRCHNNLPKGLYLDHICANRGGSPLFKNINDLAAVVLQVEPEATGQTRNSLCSFISQIARGGRAAPESLRLGIERAIRHRGAERGIDPQKIERYLVQLHPTHSVRTVTVRAGTSVLRPEDLLELQRDAGDVLILNDHPLELTDTARSNPVSAELQTALREGVAHRVQEVLFGVGSIHTAHRLWKALLAREALQDPGHAEELIRMLYTERRLGIFVAPPAALLAPSLVLDRARPEKYLACTWHAPYDWTSALAVAPAHLGTHLQAIGELLEQVERIPPPF